MIDPDALLAELTRLGRDEQRRLFEVALDLRNQAIRSTLSEIRRKHLAELSGRSAAREIYSAARGYRTGSKNPALRRRIRSLLKEQLGNLDDLPGESAMRQMLGFGDVFDL